MTKKITQIEFIERCNNANDNKYDYSKTRYLSTKDKIVVICKIHGEFECLAGNHLKGHGCVKCSTEKNSKKLRKTTKQFISELQTKRDDLHLFDLSKIDYKTNNTEIIIICKQCHYKIKTAPARFMYSNVICRNCSDPFYNCDTKKYIKLIKERKDIDNYDISRIVFVSFKDKITVLCKRCNNYFYPSAYNFYKREVGCKSCNIKETKNKKRLTQYEYLLLLKQKRNDLYLFDLTHITYKGSQHKIKIICKQCNRILFLSPHEFLNKDLGCKSCKAKKNAEHTLIKYNKKKKRDKLKRCIEYIESNYDFVFNKNEQDVYKKIKFICGYCNNILYKSIQNIYTSGNTCCKKPLGEMEIESFLNENKIDYYGQKRFDECRYKNPLVFDFYLPEHNICIEFDGYQHYEYPNTFHKSENDFEEQQLKDKIKDNYCFNKNIKLIRIPYWEKDNIENILDEELL